MNFLILFLKVFFIGCFFLGFVKGEEECLYGKINCYDCDSRLHEGCGDPFNSTSIVSKMCHGCCVKIVSNRNSDDVYVRRTCTKELDINLFMVDHVCMEASNNQGHMCFCETPNCNFANNLKLFSGANFYFLLILSTIFTISIIKQFN